MMDREQRQAVVQDFALRHEGRYNPTGFVQEVQSRGERHPAHDWFEWDEGAAAHKYRVDQARQFAQGLRVVFSVSPIGQSTIRVRTRTVPLVHSPMEGRQDGGGYVLTDTDNPEHMANLCREGASALRSWLDRYNGALDNAGGSCGAIERQISRLEAGATVDDQESVGQGDGAATSTSEPAHAV